MQKTAADSPAAKCPAPDPDRWAWPHSQSMTGAEINTFTTQLNYFTENGMVALDAERLAEKLVTRDRKLDVIRLCLECVHLAGQSAGSMRCSN